MTRRPLHILATLPTLLLLLCGCHVHEFPDVDISPAGPSVEITLNLDFSLELPPYKDIIHTPGTSRSAPERSALRYIVNYYPVDSRGTPSRSAAGSLTVTKEDISEINHTITMSLEPGSYRFLVWTDYVVQGSVGDLHYNTSDFERITLNTPHSGNDDHRDTFRGEAVADISALLSKARAGESAGATPRIEITVPMERPLGKFRFIATDFDRFMSRAEELARSEWEASRADDPANTPAEMPPVDINDYRVTISYPMYMPHVFNMFTNRPSDSRTGVSFDGHMHRLSDTEAELGFDYVFVNGSEAPVTARVDIYDAKGTHISSSGAVDIPLVRSKLTTVRGDFLTAKATGGVGVDPGFAGDINIFIP